MKKKQLIIILLISSSLILTLLFGSVMYYFTANSDITDVSASSDDDNSAVVNAMQNMLHEIAVTRTGNENDKEMRGVWISSVYNIDFPSKAGLSADEQKAELDSIIENVKAANLNTIFFQIRPTADALYKSELYPTSAYLTGEQGTELKDGFDPLAYIVEKAHQNDILLHAWINPFRITPGSKTTFESDMASLSPDNPAVVHADWTVAYEDGKLYFDPGNPNAREYIISGAVEIVKNYEVDGIHIDDYFYPYPVYVTDENGKSVIAEFDDDASYSAYGNGVERKQWRRNNINTFVSDLRDAVKAARSNCQFGVSCAGIWANSSSHPDGSATNGMQSYYDTYADSKYWIENQLIDYICPQIYWEMSHKTAPFDVLCKWWSSVVDGTNVDLYIGHALYKNATWSDKTEIPRQIEFARSWYGYKGSSFYGYDQIKNNNDGMRDNLARVFYEDYYHPTLPATGEAVRFGSPQSGDLVKVGNTFILGSSDPGYPLYYNGKKIARTQNGYFNLYETINSGDNNFTFTQNGVDTVITLTTNDPEFQPSDNNLGGMVIKNAYPNDDIIVAPGTEITLSCNAPAGSTVTVALGTQTVTLKPHGNISTSPKYLSQTYKATFKLPDDVTSDAITDLGNITFNAKLSGEAASATVANVKLKPEGYNAYIEVINDYSHLKISATSSFYNDYLPASVGMRDYIVSLSDGYYKLRFGGYIAQENAKFVEGSLLEGKILSAVGTSDEKNTTVKIGVTENIPIDAYCKDGIFTLKLYNVSTEYTPSLDSFENPLFTQVSCENDAESNTVIYKFTLKNTDNFYGFNFEYKDGAIVLNFRNPMKLDTEKTNPLEGITVIVDAGHGGTDVGALGFVSEGENALNEKDLNLLVATALEKYLTAYGATVIMTRREDATLTLDERMQLLNDTPCDLSISVHHNSLDYTSNITRVRGLIGLWWNESGRLLTKSISSSTAKGLSRYERTPIAQKLAMCRNHKFPATLIELGFITSAEEYEHITQPVNIDLAGRSIAEGVIEYFRTQQKFL